jgi:segregation and condensation protein A
MASPKVSVAERLAHLRALLRAGSFSFDEAVERADRVTVAVTLFALLELYKQGELTWTQEEPFGEIRIESVPATQPRWVRLAAAAGGAA